MFGKGRSQHLGVGYDRGYFRYVPCDLLRTRKLSRVLNVFSPRFCRACRPTPCHHSAWKRTRGVRSPFKAELVALLLAVAGATALGPWSALAGAVLD